MKKYMISISFVLLLLANSLCLAQTVGSPAPEFTLNDSNGITHKLSDYRGRHVVLEWHNAECPFVVKHYGSNNMQELQAKYTAKEVVWLTINSSAAGKQGHLTPEAANQLIAKVNSKASALLLDHDGTVGKAYAAKTTPHMFIIDPNGTLVYAGAIDSINSANPADIKTSTNYVAQALDQALAGEKITTSNTDPYGCSVKYAGKSWFNWG